MKLNDFVVVRFELLKLSLGQFFYDQCINVHIPNPKRITADRRLTRRRDAEVKITERNRLTPILNIIHHTADPINTPLTRPIICMPFPLGTVNPVAAKIPAKDIMVTGLVRVSKNVEANDPSIACSEVSIT
jgi:hypothetical protein